MSEVVCLDVDGVLADFSRGCLSVMRQMGHEFSIEHVVDYEIDRLLPPERRREFWQRVCSPGFCLGLRTLHGAKEAVRSICSSYQVRYLTTAGFPENPHWESERRAWLGRFFNSGPPEEVQRVVSFVPQGRSKAEYTGTWLVDDSPEHAKAWLRSGRPAILVRQPHNVREVERFPVVAVDVAHAAQILSPREGWPGVAKTVCAAWVEKQP